MKRDLSTTMNTDIIMDSLYDGIDFSLTLTRARFDTLNCDLFRQTLEPVMKALEDAKLSKSDIHKIVLVGGSTRIPKVQKLLQEFFVDKELDRTINPDEAVAYGTAIQAAMLSGNTSECIFGRRLQDITPLSLGIGVSDGINRGNPKMSIIIPRNTPIPVSRNEAFSTAKDFQTSVDVKIYQGESMEVEKKRFTW